MRGGILIGGVTNFHVPFPAPLPDSSVIFPLGPHTLDLLPQPLECWAHRYALSALIGEVNRGREARWSWASQPPDTGLRSRGSDVPGMHCLPTEEVPGLIGLCSRTLSLTLINPK